MNDSELETIIKKILEDKMEGSSMDINVESKNNNIHLSGMVDVLAEKMYAEKIIKSISDVKKIENNITIATDGYISDSDIEDYVVDKLEQYNDLNSISAEVEGGSVTLIGSANTYAQASKALELAMQARGAKTVVTNIKITSAGRYDDEQLYNFVNGTLLENYIDTKYVTPTISNDVVTLNGTVSNRYEMELAEELVSKIEGVKKVKNHLKYQEE